MKRTEYVAAQNMTATVYFDLGALMEAVANANRAENELTIAESDLEDHLRSHESDLQEAA